MAAGTAQVGTLRVRSATGDTPAVRLAASSWLGGAELHPSALPPSAVLIVRRMADPLPGRLPAGGPAPPDPAWERAARASLGDFCRRAVRPARGPVPPDAEAVLFADEAEMLACLALDLARGNAFGCWWWSLVLRRLGARDLPRLLAAEPARVPALLHHLTQRGHAAEVCESLSEAEAAAILETVARAHGAPELAKALSAPAGSADILPARGREGKLGPERIAAGARPQAHAVWSPLPVWQQRLRAIPDITRLAPANRVLLAVSLFLFEKPARARSAAFAAEVRVWWEAGAPLERPAPHEDEDAEPRGSRTSRVRSAAPSLPLPRDAGLPIIPRQASPTGETPRGASQQRQGRSDGPDGRSGARRRRTDQEAIGATAHRRQPMEGSRRLGDAPRGVSTVGGIDEGIGQPMASVPLSRAEQAEIEPDEPAEEDEIRAAEEAVAVDFEEGVATGIAGLFYLINLMTELEIRSEEMGAWGILEAIARDLLGPLSDDLAMDPIWKVLAELDGREFPPLPEEGSGWERGPGSEGPLRLRLARDLGLDPARPEDLPPLLLLRPGRVHVTSTHVDVVMDLESIALPVRVSGLDRDPGWLPAFGRVIQFHFH